MTRLWKTLGVVLVVAFAAVQAPASGAAEAPADLSYVAVVDALPFDGDFDHEGVTGSEAPSCAPHGDAVWFRLQLAESTRVRIDTAGSDGDTSLAVYRGAPAESAEVACNDDASRLTTTSAVFTQIDAGSEYFVRVGLATPVDDFSFHVRDAQSMKGSWASLHEDSLELDVVGGEMWLTGNHFCDFPDYTAFDIEVRQASTGAFGSRFEVIKCDNTVNTWRFPVAQDDIPFLPGEVVVTFHTYSCFGQSCLGWGGDVQSLVLRPRLSLP